MAKFILWTIGLIIGVPTAFVAFNAFMIFVFYPWLHPWNVKRMDAKNDLVWEEAIARVVTVEAELGTTEHVVKLTTDVVCYEGYFATAWNLKNGGPETGIGPKSIGFEALQAKFPTGAMLDIDMWRLCDEALLMDIDELPLKVEYSNAQIVGPELSLYCSFPFFISPSDETLLRTDVGWVSFPYIVSLEERPLRTLATRSDMGSSETPSIYSGFTRRWGSDMRRSNWKDDEGCWSGRIGSCDEAMTNYCGKNPR